MLLLAFEFLICEFALILFRFRARVSLDLDFRVLFLFLSQFDYWICWFGEGENEIRAW